MHTFLAPWALFGNGWGNSLHLVYTYLHFVPLVRKDIIYVNEQERLSNPNVQVTSCILEHNHSKGTPL